MWAKFKQRLGKIVQEVLNIFRKKKPQYEVAEGKWTINGSPIDVKFSTLESASDDSLVGKSVVLEDGELFINGESFGKVLKIDKLDLPPECFETTSAPAQLTGDIEWHGTFDMEDDLLEKLLSRAYQVLPKVINVPTLIVSSYANQEYEGIGVDISQLEETGIAHFWCTTTKTVEECMEEYDLEWEEGTESNSIIVKDATLLQWEDGHWEWVY